ncbi:MAG: hypothetical protein FGM26_04435 [Beijerinckiaceae bacterium]|nr:hypothetical protein [Beijerinckiaceae bacterium]
MAHVAQDGEDENYWPGFVDALTTMVMVLTFIMMILGLTVFSLSQNVSKILLAQIADAVNVDVPASDLSEEVVNKIIAAIGSQKKEIEGQKRKARDMAAEKTIEERSQREALLVLPGDKHQSQAPADIKPLPAGAVAGDAEIALTIVFQNNAAMFDETVRRAIMAFGQKAQDGDFIIRAYAVDNSGTITEARRLAYYRAMLVRQELVKAGLKPGQVVAQIDDSVDVKDRSVVRILAVRKSP